MLDPCPDCRCLTSAAPDPCPECAALRRKRDLRDSIVHGLRSQGWSRADAEDEADRRVYK